MLHILIPPPLVRFPQRLAPANLLVSILPEDILSLLRTTWELENHQESHTQPKHGANSDPKPFIWSGMRLDVRTQRDQDGDSSNKQEAHE